MLIGSHSSKSGGSLPGVAQKYALLLGHETDEVRYAASFFFASCFRTIRSPDDEVFLLPMLKPYLRYNAERNSLQTADGITSCLIQREAIRNDNDMNQIDSSPLSVMKTNIEGVNKAAYSCTVHNQLFSELLSNPLPSWYNQLKRVAACSPDTLSELSVLRSLSSLSSILGVSIFHSQRFFSSNHIVTDSYTKYLETSEGDDQKLHNFLSGSMSQIFVKSSKGEWGAQCMLDPALSQISQDLSKVISLRLPFKPPQLGSLRNKDGRLYSNYSQAIQTHGLEFDSFRGSEWKPRFDVLACFSHPNEHSGPVARLAVSQDQSFFVSCSHDGTCKVFETHQILDSTGILNSSLTYEEHSANDSMLMKPTCRVNDLSIIENSHSVASGDSNGVVHVWRVDTFSKNQSLHTEKVNVSPKISGVSGCTMIRKVEPNEGEILAVSHFNTPAASIVGFATHKGVHSWDLRSAFEPFNLNLRPEYGYVTSMSVGNDRNWVLAGSNRGYIALWDIRFQKLVKVWQHESCAPVNRLGICSAAANSEYSQKVVIGCGLNEIGVFDILQGSCSNCFRVLDPKLCYKDQSALPQDLTSIPTLREVNFSAERKHQTHGMRYALDQMWKSRNSDPVPNIQAFAGRVGPNDNDNYLITAGSDGLMHYWNFKSSSKCFPICGLRSVSSRPIYEKVGHISKSSLGSLFVCRQFPFSSLEEIPSTNVSKVMQMGPTRTENRHIDAILDLKKLDYPMKGILSSSRDNTIKFWR